MAQQKFKIFQHCWGKKLNKDEIDNNFWALFPFAAISPAQPVANESLFKVIRQLTAKLPQPPVEGEVWLMVFDFKTLMQ